MGRNSIDVLVGIQCVNYVDGHRLELCGFLLIVGD